MKGQGLLLAGISVVVVAVIVTGFFVMGSPGDARLEELDRRRVQDLRSVVALMTPEPGRPLRDTLDVTAYATPMSLRDPVTNEPYAYHRIDSTHFELCATFDTEVKPEDMQTWEREWAHAKGRHCYRFDTRIPGGPRPVPHGP